MRILWGALALMIVAVCASPGANRTVPLRPSDVVGTWVGYDGDYLEFYRITLDPDGTGLCTRLYLMKLAGVYRITNWTRRSDESVPMELVPRGEGAEPIRIDAALKWNYLQFAVMGPTNSWRHEGGMLYREGRFLDRVKLSAEIARDPAKWNVNQHTEWPTSPAQWEVSVWVAKSRSIFWVKLDETGSGSYWASDKNRESSEGKIESTAVVSKQLYDSILSCYKDYNPKEAPAESKKQGEENPCEDPNYLVSLEARVGEQEISFSIPDLKTLDEYPGLRPIVEESAGLLPEATRRGISR